MTAHRLKAEVLPIGRLIDGVTADDPIKLLAELLDTELLSDELAPPLDEKLFPAAEELTCFLARPNSTLRQRDAKFKEQRVSPTL